MRDIVQRAREGASEHNSMVRTPTVAKREATTLKHNCRVRITKAAKTKTTKQKQHTTHDYSIYSSVAISVHCCLHRCSHLAFIPPSCIGVRTLHVSIAVRCLVLLCTAITRAVRCLPWPTGAESAIMANIVSGTWATSTSVGRCIMSRKPPGIGTGTKC